MAVYKCKMCGAQLQIQEGMSVCECEYCGTQQTLPKTDSEQVLNMVNRANHFRQQCEFDKAADIYEKLIARNGADAELYWSLVLCRYGIEYVDDPLTKQKIATCHRTQYRSILQDADYLAALEHADTLQRPVYEREAKYIDTVQKGILEISNKEEPFDVFICYKETDDSGARTPDSVLAQDLYYQLEREGFKVFFSRITLEHKLGEEYEPYIFAALNSAKVMVVVGTKPEYFNAVWVRNEWSRYLMLMREDHTRTLIPAYKDMDPYDLPDALSMFQAQDMSKLGFMQDLIHGISKIVRDEPSQPKVVEKTVVQNYGTPEVKPLLKRASLFLEDKDWKSAEEYCNKVLDIDPECAQAYFFLLMADLNIPTEKQFEEACFSKGIDQEDNYKKAWRFGDEEMRQKLDSLHRQTLYNAALSQMQSATTDTDYDYAKDQFKQLGDFKDAAEKARECEQGALQLRYKAASDTLSTARTESQCKRAQEMFLELNDFRDAAEKARECEERAEEFRRERIYREACGLCATKWTPESDGDKFELDRKLAIKKFESDRKLAIKFFESILNYKDSRERAEKCKTELDEYHRELEKLRQEAEKAKRKKARNKKIAIMASITAAVLVVVGVVLGIRHRTEIIEKEQEAILQKREAILPYQGTIAAGSYHTVALKSDGRVIATEIITDVIGPEDRDDGQCEVPKRTDIVAVAAGVMHTVCLKSNGTVVAVGDNSEGQCNVEEWTGITAIASTSFHTVGLKSNGTVVATGHRTQDWKDIVAVAAGFGHTVGLKSDGTVVATGDNDDGQCDVSNWTDIVAIAAGNNHTVGLKSDGTVVATGENYSDQCDVSDWKNIVAVSAGYRHTVGLRADGTVVETSYHKGISEWDDIVSVSAGETHIIGLKSDGTVVAVGNNDCGQCNVSGWTGIGPAKG